MTTDYTDYTDHRMTTDYTDHRMTTDYTDYTDEPARRVVEYYHADNH